MSEKTEWVTVKVPKEKRATANDYKPDDVTWGDCLVAGAEHLTEHLASDPETYRDYSPQDIVDYIDQEVSLREGVDADTIAQRVAERFDYAEVSKRVADDLEGRMR